MVSLKNVTELNAAIASLEERKVQEIALVKEHMQPICEELKPLNLLKNTLNELMTGPEVKENVINASMSLVTGYLSKQFAVGNTQNPLKQIMGSLFQMGITKVVYNNADAIRTSLMGLLVPFQSTKKPKNED